MRLITICFFSCFLVACGGTQMDLSHYALGGPGSANLGVWLSNDEKALIHSATETAFPLEVGDYHRAKHMAFKANGSDVGITYKLKS